MRRLAAIAIGLCALACGHNNESPTAPGPPSPADVSVTINGIDTGAAFTPNPATLAAGQTIAWKNADIHPQPHRIVANDGSFDTGLIQPGAWSIAVRVTAPGSHVYHDDLHATMVGTIVAK